MKRFVDILFGVILTLMSLILVTEWYGREFLTDYWCYNIYYGDYSKEFYITKVITIGILTMLSFIIANNGDKPKLDV